MQEILEKWNNKLVVHNSKKWFSNLGMFFFTFLKIRQKKTRDIRLFNRKQSIEIRNPFSRVFWFRFLTGTDQPMLLSDLTKSISTSKLYIFIIFRSHRNISFKYGRIIEKAATHG